MNNSMSTLITVIFGLMLADLFASVHRLIRNRRRIRWHWLPMAVAWYVLAMVLKNWWSLVGSQGGAALEGGWVFLFYGHLLLVLYLVVSAVLPDEIPVEGLDLKEFYFDTRVHFWGLLAAVNLILLLFALLRPLFYAGMSVNWMAVVSNAVMGAIILSLAFTRRCAYHASVVLVLVVLVMVELAFKL